MRDRALAHGRTTLAAATAGPDPAEPPAQEPPRPVAPQTPRPGRTWGAAYRTAGAAFVLTQLAAGLTNLGFHVTMSRLLGPADYGEVVSLLAFVAVLAVPAMAMQTIVTARVAVRVAGGAPVRAGAMVRRATVVGVVTSALLLAATPALRGYLSLRSAGPLVVLALGCVPMTVSVVLSGLLCGQRRLLTAGRIALGLAFVRVLAATLLVSGGYGVTGAMAATTATECLAAVLYGVALTRPSGQRAQRGARRQDRFRTVAGVCALAGVWLVITVDGALARHLLTPMAAGQYQAASMAGRAVYFTAQALCLVAVPIFAETDARRAAAALRVTLKATAGFGGALVATFAVAGSRLAAFAFGPAYRVPSSLMALVALGTTGLSLIWVLVQYQLVRGGRAAAAWAAPAVVAVAGSLVARTAYELAAVVVAGCVTGVAALAMHARDDRPHPPAPVPPLPRAATGGVDLTIVVPYFNPGDGLRAHLLDLVATLRGSGVSFEVIAVADGCTDGSPDTIADLDPAAVRRFALPRNGGKGAALRLGLGHSRGRYVGFIDADGDLDPRVLRSFLSLMSLYQPDAVIGAKRHPLSEVDEGSRFLRRLCSAGYRGMVRLLFPTLRVRETQVGVKVFRRELLHDVLPRTVEPGFIFDLELLAAAQRLGYRRILPAPVQMQRTGPSTIRPRAVWGMFTGTVALAWRVWAARRYDDAPAVALRPARTDQAAGPLTRLGFGEVW